MTDPQLHGVLDGSADFVSFFAFLSLMYPV